jgi:arsenite methyltransferase
MHTTTSPAAIPAQQKPDYGIDAPNVLRNLFLFGALLLIAAPFLRPIHLGHVTLILRPMFLWTGSFLLAEALLYLLYVKIGKLHHRDSLLALHRWHGDEQVLDVGCGRGLLLAGAAKRIPDGHATGIDIWSNVDMGNNSLAATQRNLALEGVAARSTLLSHPAQQMPFADAHFDVIVSNLCLHNIYDRPTREKAISEIARVLKPGGQALLSDYKNTRQYARQLRSLGFEVNRKHGSLFATFPPLPIVIATKPLREPR